MKIQLIIISVISVIAFLGLVDITTYLIKSSLKVCHFNKLFHKISYLCVMGVLYYILNGYKFV